MPAEHISKAKIKWLRSLQQKKSRTEENVFVVEGEKMVLEGLREVPDDLVLLVRSKDYLADSLPDTTFIADETEMSQISGLKTPNKLIGVFRRPKQAELSKRSHLVLDGVQDPGNLGTILRIADWFGIQEIVCSVETADCYNPKVIQATMGAIFRIPVHYTDLKEHLRTCESPVYGALLNGVPYRKANMQPEGILVLGNEGSGISSEVLEFISTPVTIPGNGNAESLNVATAAAILAAEMFG